MSEADLRRRLDSVTAELLATYEEMEVLTTVAEIAGASADIRTVGGRILGEAAALLQSEVGFLIYSDAELRGEEPDPVGLTPPERDALGRALEGWLGTDPRPAVMAPFVEGAGVPHAPDALLAVPLRCEGLVLGAICLGRRGEGQTFTSGDLKVLSVLASSAASVLLQRKNLDLVRLTRGLEERNKLLKGILEISREIAASLDLDRLLHVLARLPTRALGFDRGSVMLEEGARRRLRAVSGMGRVDRSDPELRSLEQLMDWTAGRGVRLVVQEPREGEPAAAEPPEAAAQAAPHMKISGARSILVMPLRDDQGLLGAMAFESGAAGFIDAMKLEGITILANQATVALRNARLYGEVPFIGLLAPLRSGLSRVRGLPRRRMAVWAAVALVAAGVLVFGRWHLRVGGKATVMPMQVTLVSARVRGVVREVAAYREGDHVERGAVLARLDTPDLALRLNESAAREQAAVRTLARLEAEGKAADVRLTRVEMERWKGERQHLERMIEDATLRAPIAGIVLTPRLEERVGELLDVGGVFCTLADVDRLRVEIAVRENEADVLLLPRGPGEMQAALKFHAFPEIDYVARIRRVRSAAEMVDGRPALVAEGEVGGSPGQPVPRPGMTANARIDAGSRPLIAVILRRPWRFLMSLLWV